MYGNPISELAQFDKEMNPNALPVPTPIFKLMEFLNDHCLSVEGLFRVSGNQNEVDVERRKIDAWENVEFGSTKQAHLASGLLKKYFRELPEPLLTYGLFDGSLILLLFSIFYHLFLFLFLFFLFLFPFPFPFPFFFLSFFFLTLFP